MMSDELIKELRSYPAHYVAAHRAADALEKREYYVCRLEDDLVKLEAAAESLREHIAQQQLDIITLGQEVGRLREASKKAYQDSLDAVEKIKSDVFTDLGKHHKSAFGSATAKDWMIAIAEDIQREITARAVLGEEKKP
jgi:hypothetical protein